MAPALETLFDTPEHHLLGFDGDEALFVRMDEAAYRRSIFLDRRAAALDPEPVRMALAPLVDAVRERAIPPTGWIFHVAHCGSTLLSRLIDQPGSGLVLREPPPLRQLAILAASGRRGADWAGRLKLASVLAGRRFDPDQPTVVKANVPVNFILPDITACAPVAPAVLLHFALEPYLLAVLRTAERRAWVDRVTGLLAPALAERVGLAAGAGAVERAAALWLAQMLAFDSALGANPAARSLDAEAFFAAPVSVAKVVALHLGRAWIDPGDLEALAATYSKDPSRPFDEAARRQRQRDDRVRLQDDVGAARRWIDQAPVATALPPCLARPLSGAACALLD